MDQEQVNQAEWENPENWTSGKWGGVYFSHTDSRVWVPKKIAKMGWTLNLAKSAAVAWLVGFLVGIPLLTAVIVLFFTNFSSQ